jgi:segregation and condensation protein A
MTRDTTYQIEIDVYQGPFDLLLKAIDDGEIDIYRVSLSQVTNAYFVYWKKQDPPLILASDFLFMAAYLLELKSKSMLPAREEILAEELLGVEESLVSHIQEYAVFKGLAQTLKERKKVFSKVYGRHEGEGQEQVFELVDISLRDLVQAFQKVYSEAAKRESIVPIEEEEVKLEDRIQEIKDMLSRRTGGVAFEEIFIRKTRLEIVVTFLAILELAKQNLIRITQDMRFGTILIVPMKEKEEVPVGES